MTSAPVAIRNRQLLVATHNSRIVTQADERAFDVLQMSEAERIAIRKIDEEQGRRAQAGAGDPGADTGPATVDQQIGIGVARNDQVERDRRAAIKDLLGPERFTDFAAAEYAEARRLRIQYRKQMAAELDSAAPWPQGVPRGAH